MQQVMTYKSDVGQRWNLTKDVQKIAHKTLQNNNFTINYQNHKKMDLTHPSSSDDWNDLSVEERNSRIHLWKLQMKRGKEKNRRKVSFEMKTFDWNFKRRKMEDVLNF